MLEELLEVGLTTREGQLTTFAYIPNEPSYLQYRPGTQAFQDYLYNYGSEYQTNSGPLSAFNDHIVWGAICVKIMFFLLFIYPALYL